MPPKVQTCDVCKVQASKYRCSACPVRYCSVPCYKTHKETAHPVLDPAPSDAQPPTATLALAAVEPSVDPAPTPPPTPLRPLTSLAWPPEPDADTFTDPLRRDDAKPLRRAELERIATSAPLRALLADPALVRVLGALDAVPHAAARSAALARLLGVDSDSLARPAALLRHSPPPLDDLLRAVTGEQVGVPAREHVVAKGWWLGQGEGRVWIGEEEKRAMRAWAAVVVGAIDGEGRGDEWGTGALEWSI
ncbi:hypothetical protein Q5752_002791 [Cryptotrichosporon argae]